MLKSWDYGHPDCRPLVTAMVGDSTDELADGVRLWAALRTTDLLGNRPKLDEAKRERAF